MKKAIKIILPIIIIAIIVLIILNQKHIEHGEMIPIKSQMELEKIYNQEIGEDTTLEKLLKLPFSLLVDYSSRSINYYTVDTAIQQNTEKTIGINSANMFEDSANESTKEYSTTNIQVENVDEADITKTDGDYIYSLSKNDVIITDVKQPEQMKIVARISESNSNKIPEDLILYQNKLIIIY